MGGEKLKKNNQETLANPEISSKYITRSVDLHCTHGVRESMNPS